MAKPFEELLKKIPSTPSSPRDRVSRLLAEMPLNQQRVRDKHFQDDRKSQ